MKRLTAFLVSLALVLAACGAPQEPTPSLKSIAGTATDAGVFGLLLDALEAADLADTFADDEAGPFTVFAPTDTAFAALIATVNDLFDLELEGLDDLVAAVGMDYVTDVLTYHVVAGKLMAADVIAEESLDTLLGQPLFVVVDEDGVQVGTDVTGIYANVTETDIEATNGVIHVIDFVLLPYLPEIEEELLTIAEIAVADGRFDTLVAALVAADLADTFADAEAGPFTVFAPTDDAFDALPDGTLEGLLGDIPALTNILTYHVVDGVLMASDVLDAIDAGGGSASVTTLQGSDIVATLVDGGVVLNGEVNVIITDIVASNGVIHVIDAVLLPTD